MEFTIPQRDVKTIEKFDSDFNINAIAAVGLNSYPQIFRYILLLLGEETGAGYTTIKVLGKGIDKKFYCVECYDYIDFNGAVKIDYYGRICRVQALGKQVETKLGIYRLFLQSIMDAVGFKKMIARRQGFKIREG